MVVTRTISEVAAEVGVRPDTLRYYERVGLLAPPVRAANGYRTYEADTGGRVRFIKGAQRMGLRLRDIKDLLDIRDRGACPCGHTRALLRQRLAEIDGELRRLRVLRRDLAAMLAEAENCPPAPAGVWWCEAEFTRKGGDPRET